jgi:formamidopyrimidine-DNA glycosylase
MPELPDVEVFSTYLKSTALHKKISAVEVNTQKVLSGISAGRLRNTLEGRTLEAARRHGKYLFVRLVEGMWLFLHFGMTGRLRYFKDRDKEKDHDRILFLFSNGYHLAYESRRMLGKVGLLEDPDSFIREKGLGPDAFQLDFRRFNQILDGRRGSIKSVLMNQKAIAGIGNIYSDEILFHAGIHPASRTGGLDRRKRKEVFRSMGRVLTTAVKCKADPAEFPGSFLLTKRREGEKCPYCRVYINKSRITGRSSYYCPSCQRRYD